MTGEQVPTRCGRIANRRESQSSSVAEANLNLVCTVLNRRPKPKRILRIESEGQLTHVPPRGRINSHIRPLSSPFLPWAWRGFRRCATLWKTGNLCFSTFREEDITGLGHGDRDIAHSKPIIGRVSFGHTKALRRNHSNRDSGHIFRRENTLQKEMSTDGG